MELFEACVMEGWVEDGVISQSLSQAEKFVEVTRGYVGKRSPGGNLTKTISASTFSRMPEFLAKVDVLVANEYPDF